VEIAGEATYMGTVIIVDTIGPKSRVPKLAAAADASVIQMSGSYWPRDLGGVLAEIVPHWDSPMEGMTDAESAEFVADRMESAPFHEVVGVVADEPVDDASSDSPADLDES